MSNSMSTIKGLSALSLPLSVFFIPTTLCGQPASAPARAGQVLELKVLQDTPADSFNQSMHLISGALGVKCEILPCRKGFRKRRGAQERDRARYARG